MSTETLTQIGRFEVLQFLGRSNTGAVYRVRDPRTGEMRAVKVLDPHHLARAGGVGKLREEIDAVAAMHHPNIVDISEVHLDFDPPYLVMELATGGSLRDAMKKRRLSVFEALDIFEKICMGLEAAHRQGVAHRELGPHNVMLGNDPPAVKLADFGLGPLLDFNERVSESTTGSFDAGRISYLAPEYLMHRQADARSDIYSAGVLLYQMLTGRMPQGRFTLPSQINGEVPAELDPIVLRCLAENPSERYSSTSQLLADLRATEEKLRFHLGSNLRDLTKPIPRQGTQQRLSTALLVAVAVISLLVVLLLLMVRRVGNTGLQGTGVPGAPGQTGSEPTEPIVGSGDQGTEQEP